MFTTVINAAEIEIRSENGKGKIVSEKLEGDEVKIDVTAKLYDGNNVLKSEYVTFAMYGALEPDTFYYERTINGKKYYSYYMDQVRTNKYGEVDFSFTVNIPEEENCYLIFSGNGVDKPFELEIVLPPIAAQVIKPMEKPSAVSGGGGGRSYVGGGAVSYGTAQQPDTFFNDITAEHWAYDDCLKLYKLGIINGDGNKLLRPSDNISREETVTVLTKAFELKMSDENLYINGTSSLWAENYIKAAVQNGVMLYNADGIYRGKDNITRTEAVTMINRCLGDENGTDITDAFGDFEDIPNYGKAAFAVLINKGIISGYPDNTLRPKANITRAELFKIISRVLEEK